MEISIFGFLVEATGLKGVTETLKAFIYKGLRVFTPRRSQKTLLHVPNVINTFIYTLPTTKE